MSFPLSVSDLREIASALEPLELLEAITENPIIGDIEVYRPDGDPGSSDVVGRFVRVGNPNGSGEAWYGFQPTTT